MLTAEQQTKLLLEKLGLQKTVAQAAEAGDLVLLRDARNSLHRLIGPEDAEHALYKVALHPQIFLEKVTQK